MDPVVATVGTFDGVHRGHRFLINQVKEVAGRLGLASMVVSFRRPPILVLKPKLSPSFLTTVEEKVYRLEQTGISRVELLDFDEGMAMLSAEQFIVDVLHRELNVSHLIVGHDHRFGHNRKDGFEDYQHYAKSVGMQVELATVLSLGNAELCSSTIRRLLQQGQLAEANEMLGYSYRISGKVVGGYRNGRLLGYPTANIELSDPYKLLPPDGVYAVQVYLTDRQYKGMLYIGKRPTFDNGESRSIEVNIFDLDENLYGSDIAVDLIARTRGDKKFDTMEGLAAQLHLDAVCCNRILAERG